MLVFIHKKNFPKKNDTGCPINMATCSTLIFSFCISATAKVKPLLKSLDPNLQGVTLILIFFKKLDYFLGSAKNEIKQKLHGFEEKTKFHVHVHESEKTKSWDISKKGVGAWRQKKFCFVSFFSNPKN
jgi:hypothetical protein